MRPEQHDYSNLSDEGLQRAAALLKLDLNANYGTSLPPGATPSKALDIYAKMQAIRAEQKRRQK